MAKAAKKEDAKKPEPKPKKSLTSLVKGKDSKKEAPKKKKDEKVEIVEDKEDAVYQAKKKPVLDDKTKRSLGIKEQQAKTRPRFRRQEWFRYKRLGTKWRKPRGLTSSMRQNKKYRPNKVTVGYRSPKDTRHYHPSGFKEVLVHNPKQLKEIDPKTQAIRIGHSVGTRKRTEIIDAAAKLEIRVLNKGV